MKVRSDKRGRWRFGVRQTVQQEKREIRAAQESGATDSYMAGQRHAAMIAAEAARRAHRRRAQAQCLGVETGDGKRAASR